MKAETRRAKPGSRDVRSGRSLCVESRRVTRRAHARCRGRARRDPCVRRGSRRRARRFGAGGVHRAGPASTVSEHEWSAVVSARCRGALSSGSLHDVRRGTIAMTFEAALQGSTPSGTLRFSNRHASTRAAYLVNCLLPHDPSIHFLSQLRSPNQASYQVELGSGMKSKLTSGLSSGGRTMNKRDVAWKRSSRARFRRTDDQPKMQQTCLLPTTYAARPIQNVSLSKSRTGRVRDAARGARHLGCPSCNYVEGLYSWCRATSDVRARRREPRS
jgi:hypothetical protein